MGIAEHLNVILIIPHSHYYRVGGHPKALVVLGTLVVGDNQEVSPGPGRVFRLLLSYTLNPFGHLSLYIGRACSG